MITATSINLASRFIQDGRPSALSLVRDGLPELED
jgi:hypothetical protein